MEGFAFMTIVFLGLLVSNSLRMHPFCHVTFRYISVLNCEAQANILPYRKGKNFTQWIGKRENATDTEPVDITKQIAMNDLGYDYRFATSQESPPVPDGGPLTESDELGTTFLRMYKITEMIQNLEMQKEVYKSFPWIPLRSHDHHLIQSVLEIQQSSCGSSHSREVATLLDVNLPLSPVALQPPSAVQLSRNIRSENIHAAGLLDDWSFEVI